MTLQKKKRLTVLADQTLGGAASHTACLTLYSHSGPHGDIVSVGRKDGRMAHWGGWAISHKPFALSGPQLPSLQHGQKQPSLLACCEQLGEQNVPLASEQSEGGGPARSCCFTEKSRYAKSLSVKMPTAAICQWAVCTHNTAGTTCAMSSPVLQYQLGVLQFSSALTLSTRSWCQIPQVKGSVPQACLRFRHGGTDRLAINRGILDP